MTERDKDMLTEIEKSLDYWTSNAIRDMQKADPYKQRDVCLERAARLATIALALRARMGQPS